MKKTDRYPEALELAVKVTMHLYPKPNGPNATKEFMERLVEVVHELNSFITPQPDADQSTGSEPVNKQFVAKF